jgi:hypothetical protein
MIVETHLIIDFISGEFMVLVRKIDEVEDDLKSFISILYMLNNYNE